MPMSPQDVDHVVRTVIGESSPDPSEQQAVAAVIRNRANATGASLSDVVHAPHQFEAWTAHGDRLASIDPSSKVYQNVLARVAPVLSGKALSDFDADAFYAPHAQAALGRQAPSWDDGSGQDIGQSRFLTVGGHYGIHGRGTATRDTNGRRVNPPPPQPQAQAHGVPVAPPPPTPEEFSARNGVGGDQAPEPPSPEEFAARNGVQATPSVQQQSAGTARPQSAGMRRAIADAQRLAAIRNRGAFSGVGPIEATANSMAFGLQPAFDGAVAAGKTGVKNLLAKTGLVDPAGYSMSDAYDAERGVEQAEYDAYATKHPVANAAANVVGLMTGGPAQAVDKLATKGILKAAPKLAASMPGRVAVRAAGVGAAGAAAGAGHSLSEGNDASQIAQDAATSGGLSIPFGVAGEGLGTVASKLRSPAVRVALPTALGTAGGATVGGLTGYATGGEKGAVSGAENGALSGLVLGATLGRGKVREGALPTTSERATALDMVAKAGPKDASAAPHTATAEALDQAIPEHTTAEALGPQGQALVKAATQGGSAPISDVVSGRQSPSSIMDRVSKGVQEATGIDPENAQMSAYDRVDAARKGPARAAYEAAITGNPIWTPELAELAKEPEVRAQMNNAKRLLGPSSVVPNPEAATTPAFPASMSSAELRSRMEGDGTIAPGEEVSTNDLMQYLKGKTYDLAPDVQRRVPTDEMWDLTKQLLDKSVKRDAFGKPEVSTENHLAQHWSSLLRKATNDAIPGLEKARSISGEYLSSDRAYNNGTDLWSTGKGGETLAAFNKRYAKLTPAEQEATQTGYLAEMYRRLENGKFNVKDAADSPFHQGVRETLFGPERAAQVQSVLQKEQALAASGALMQSSAKPGTPADKEHGGAGLGMVMAAAEHGLHPAALLHGAVAGAVGKGVGGLVKTIQAGKVTPGVRNALAEIVAQPPHETAKQLRLRHSQQRQVPLSESLIKNELKRSALRGIAVAAGMGTANALRDHAAQN